MNFVERLKRPAPLARSTQHYEPPQWGHHAAEALSQFRRFSRERPKLTYFVEKLGDYLLVFGLIKRGLTRSAWRLAAVNRFEIISFWFWRSVCLLRWRERRIRWRWMPGLRHAPEVLSDSSE